MKAYVFPGQGSQFTGMGKDLFEQSEIARTMFARADEVLGFSLSQVMFTGTDEELKQMEARGFVFSDAQKTAYKTIGGTPFLDAQYTVFGEVVEGLDVLDKIAATETKPGDRPAKDVKMTVKIVE